ncbi:YkgJ family cysteine cluster protein [Pseudidiomarina piscicola]|uniref:YkgJ family cysteine cluster protein n=1 Tax=Pseudidiomarina piscicola TaxID=2614830 RepID=UPI001570BDC9|nr:YkgJ family cysteine cluster protein [Pseudidiomarina piscicola]
MDCRAGCGACCIAPSITSAIPGMPAGKPAGIRCIHLTETNLCGIFDHPDRPKVCAEFTASVDTCGSHRDEALILLTRLETETS